jgi:hypothetical protein
MRSAFVWLVLVAILASSSAASAHAAGSANITAKGSFVLTPTGTQNSTLHAYISSMGLPIGQGDTLQVLWYANAGQGPPIHFEIHDHDPPTGYVLFYSVNESYDAYNWSVPGSSAYMVYWVNPNSQNVTVAYVFNLVAPPASPWTALIWIVPTVVLVGLLSLRLFRWAARKRPARAEETRAGSASGRDGSRVDEPEGGQATKDR